jgi:hypothetical protein
MLKKVKYAQSKVWSNIKRSNIAFPYDLFATIMNQTQILNK